MLFLAMYEIGLLTTPSAQASKMERVNDSRQGLPFDLCWRVIVAMLWESR